MLISLSKVAVYPSGKVIVVTSGVKFGEISGANQYCSTAACARESENAGVIIVMKPGPEVIVANEGIVIAADELSACITVTGSLRFEFRAFWSSVAGSSI